MAEELARPRLGRGLAALIGGGTEDNQVFDKTRVQQKRVAVEFLRPNPFNPRKYFADNELDELAQSLKERGFIQPIAVRSVPGMVDVYDIIAGERRWRAAQRAGLHEVPVVVLEADDKKALEFAIIENIQRTDLNPLEEAGGYEQLISMFSYSQTDLAQSLGKSRSYVANMLRLMKLPDSIKTLIEQGQISAGHARALLAVDQPELVAKRIVEHGLSVRDVERLAQEQQDNPPRQIMRGRKDKDPDTRALEKALEDVLGLGVNVQHHGKGGELRLRYTSLEQLDGLCRQLKDAVVYKAV